MTESVQTFRPNPERLLRWFVVLVGAASLALAAWWFSRLVVYVLVGLLLAYVMRPLKDRIQALGTGPVPSILATFAVFFGVAALLIRTMIPFAAQQVGAVANQLSPEAVSATVADGVARWLPVEAESVRSALVRALETLLREERVTRVAGSVIDLFTNVFYALAVVPFVAFFFLKDGSRIRHGLLAMVPNRYFEVTLGIVDKVESTVGRYFRALAAQSLSIAVLASVLLAFVGLDYAPAVGLFTGLANTIPYFGPLLGFAAGTLVGISQTGDFALFPGVILAMGLTQLADNLIFQPLIFSRAAKAHPLVILFTVLIAAEVAGIAGMLIAIPVMTIGRVLVREVAWSMRHYRGLRLA